MAKNKKESLKLEYQKIVDGYEKFLKEKEKIEKIEKNQNEEVKLITDNFPKKDLSKITLEDYCIGKGTDNNFCYLFERGSESLGSIRGGNAYKFGVYYSQKEEVYKYTNKFDNEDDAIEKIKNEIVEIVNSKSLENLENLDILSDMLKYKIFYVYNPDKIIPIYSSNFLKIIFKNNKLEYINYSNAQKILFEIFEKVKEKNKEATTLNFMYFLVGFYNFGEIIKRITKDQIISQENLYNILISLTVNNFLIFSGPSGTGKTSIVEKIAESFNGKDKNNKTIGFHKLPIKSNFTDESAILGYWNPLLSKYEGTETLKFLIDAYKNPEQLHFLLLDEMNLSKVENYFSTFLSEIDKLKDGNGESKILLFETNISNTKQYKNIKYFIKAFEIPDNFISGDYKDLESAEIDDNNNYKEVKAIKINLILSKNLKIIGTINEDETTNSLSNKVLDRSQFITFEVADLFGENNDEFENEELFKRNFIDLEKQEKIKQNEIKSTFEKAKNDFENIQKLINSINKEIQNISINESIGYRTIEEIMTYIKNYCDYDGKSKNIQNLTKALDNQIAQKVLTKLKTFSLIGDEQREAFKRILQILEKLEYKKGEEVIKINLDGKLEKSLKFYKHLETNLLD